MCDMVGLERGGGGGGGGRGLRGGVVLRGCWDEAKGLRVHVQEGQEGGAQEEEGGGGRGGRR